jgi:small conductance mechanosensitive channel
MNWDDVIDLVLTGLRHLAAAGAVLIVGYVVARVTRRIVGRLLKQYETTLGPSIVRLAIRSVYYILLVLTVALSLIALGIPATFVSAVTLLILVILAVAVQQSIADLAATVVFLVFQPFKREELVETMGYLGEVQEILLFNTVLLLGDQRLVTLPNSKIQASGVENYTRMGRVRAGFTFTVGYGEDLDHVRAVVTEVASADARILNSPPFEVATEELTEIGVRLRVLPTVAPNNYSAVGGELREQVKARLDAEGIRFAVPPRDVTVRQPQSPSGNPA